MKSLSVVVTALIVAALTVPADAASPPGKELARLKREVAALRAKVSRLEAENRVLVRSNASALRRERAVTRHLAGVDPCPITRPHGSAPPGSTSGSEFHGNGAIWVGVWPSNIVVWEHRSDGSVDAKFGWWRGVPGQLRIDGRRLDGPAPPLTVPDGYGESGFQATGIVFPSEGCWEVTGRVGDASLTFVTLVIAA